MGMSAHLTARQLEYEQVCMILDKTLLYIVPFAARGRETYVG